MHLRLTLIYVSFVIRLLLLLLLPVLPFIYFLGKRIKAKVPDLPEASKSLSGKIDGAEGSYELLLLGESSIAGVGIDDHREGIPGEIARIFQKEISKGLSWKVVAKSGFRAVDTYQELLPKLPKSSFDLIVVGLGGNDTFQMTPPWTWRREVLKLLKELETRYPDSIILMSAMPPIADFPVFPPVIKLFLGGHINFLRKSVCDIPQLGKRFLYLHEKVRIKDWMNSETSHHMTDFFSDGVHPSALTYQLIGREIAKKLIEERILDVSLEKVEY